MKNFDTTMLHVGTTPQYFFDNLLIEQAQDVTKKFHYPEKHPEPVLTKDKPWEIIPYLTINGWSIIKEDNGDLKCYYDDWPCDIDEVVKQKTIYLCRGFTSLALSKDGLNWEKPELGIIKRDGMDTNIVVGMPKYSKLDATHVFKDILDKDPSRRYKMFLTHYVTSEPEEIGRFDLHTKMNATVENDVNERVEIEILYSADGLNWIPMDELPRFGRDGNKLGDGYTIFMDEDTGEYRLVTRAMGMTGIELDKRRPCTDSFLLPVFPHDIGRMNKRRIFQAVSSDLIHWSRPQPIFTPDVEEDNLDDSFYGTTQIKMGDIYIGFVNAFHEVENTVDVILIYSRDGWNWTALNNRKPWLTTSKEGWDRFMVNIGSAPVIMGNELFVFYGGSSNHHDWWITGKLENLDPVLVPEAYDLNLVDYSLGLAKIRKDGFISVDAGAVREGLFITRSMWTDGKKLILNAECGPGGYIKVEATDSQEQVLGNCTKAECDAFSGNNIEYIVTWKGEPEIPVKGCIRLRFYMKNASLYSFKFE